MVGDPIGDFLIRIKHAQERGHESVSAPYSRLKQNVADVLAREGFIKSAVKKGKKVKKQIEVDLLYTGGTPRIKGVKRISLPGKRVYAGAKEIARVGGRRGVIIVSTPRGVLTSKDALTQKVGGEVLCKVW